MASNQTPDEIQRIQSAYRRRILDCWNIPLGARVLEVGCGQGDMTAVLAEAVGENGNVVATDIAGRNYGSPLTLGEATDNIKTTNLGKRIDFHFEFDILNPLFDFGEFDFAVMAHCSWYFTSTDQLSETFSALAKHARYLCFAEWNSYPMSADQVPHQVAVLIQSNLERYKTESQSNIRNPFTLDKIFRLISETGWKLCKSGVPSTAGLQDADWEIAECLANTVSQARLMDLPSGVLSRIEKEVAYLQEIALTTGNEPLSSMAFMAERL